MEPAVVRQAKAVGGLIGIVAILFFLWFTFVAIPVATELWHNWRAWCQQKRAQRDHRKQAHSITVEESHSGGYQVVE